MSAPAEALVVGIVLAAGSSTRMGRDKLYLELAGEALLRRSVRQALEAELDAVHVVTGPHSERARRELRGLAVTLVPNPAHADGQHTSLRAGVESVPADAAAALVVLADMPFVTPAMLSEVVRRYRLERPLLVVSRYGAVTAPPTLYDRSLFAECVGGDTGKQIVERHLDSATIVDWPAARLHDLDDEDDYRRARALTGASGGAGEG